MLKIEYSMGYFVISLLYFMRAPVNFIQSQVLISITEHIKGFKTYRIFSF